MNDFLGKAIIGSIDSYHYRKPTEQHNPVELIKALEKFLQVKGVCGIRWAQYTPYFNDGDPCYFSTHELRVLLDKKLFGDDVVQEIYDDSDYGDSVTDYDLRYNLQPKFEKILHSISKALDEFYNEFAHHELIMQEKFGDPAEVTALFNDNGELEFHVEFYEHE